MSLEVRLISYQGGSGGGLTRGEKVIKATFRGEMKKSNRMCMHVCMYGIEVALRGIAHGIGRPTWSEGGAHLKVGPMSQPHGYLQSCVTHSGSYLHTWCAFCNQLYSRQLRVTCFLI